MKIENIEVCKKHPLYRGLRKSRTGCDTCSHIYLSNKSGKDSALKKDSSRLKKGKNDILKVLERHLCALTKFCNYVNQLRMKNSYHSKKKDCG